MGDENIEEFNAALESPEALIAFKERNWPIFRDVTADEVAEAFGDLVDDVDRGSLTGGSRTSPQPLSAKRCASRTGAGSTTTWP